MGLTLDRSYILVLITAAALLAPAGASAQRRISAGVEVKQAAGGKVATVTKRVFCSLDGRIVVHFLKPEDYIVTSNVKGETRLFIPRTNEVVMDNTAVMTSQDDIFRYLSAYPEKERQIGFFDEDVVLNGS